MSGNFPKFNKAINKSILIEGLEELSDRQLQTDLWCGKLDGQMGSFDEASCYVFDDSGISSIFTSYQFAQASHQARFKDVIPQNIRALFVELSNLLNKVDRNRKPEDIIEDKAMSPVREVSKKILFLVQEDGFEFGNIDYQA